MNQQPAPLYGYLSRLLAVGIVLSLALMGLGYILLAARGGSGHDAWLPLDQVIPCALAGDARGILDLGILVLLVIPATRVVASIVFFAVDRKPRYVAIESLVLVLLVVSVVIAQLRH